VEMINDIGIFVLLPIISIMSTGETPWGMYGGGMGGAFEAHVNNSYLKYTGCREDQG